jgi:hypothetical protein
MRQLQIYKSAESSPHVNDSQYDILYLSGKIGTVQSIPCAMGSRVDCAQAETL